MTRTAGDVGEVEIVRKAGRRIARMLAAAGALSLIAGAAFAQGAIDGHIGMQAAESGLAEEVHFFHNVILLPIITAISLFVLALLLWIVFRYNAKANPVPAKFSHNTMIEIVWTGVPVLILLVIALPSFELLYKMDATPDGKEVAYDGDGATNVFVFENAFAERRRLTRNEHVQVFIDRGQGREALRHRADYTLEGLGEQAIRVALNAAPAAGQTVYVRGGRMKLRRGEIKLAPSMTIKAVGYQWNWLYSYPDHGDFDFFSNMLPEDQTTPALYRFEVDNRVVVPVGETVRIITTANDVIHSWAMPAFGIKIDAVPGRNNETWFNADREGVFYGQCSEICGVRHAFMPIAVEVVSRERFEAWIDEQRALAGLDPMYAGEVRLAARENQ